VRCGLSPDGTILRGSVTRMLRL